MNLLLRNIAVENKIDKNLNPRYPGNVFRTQQN